MNDFLQLFGLLSLAAGYYGWRISKRAGHPSKEAIAQFKNNHKNRNSGIVEYFFVYFGLCVHIAVFEIYDNIRSRL